MFIPVTVTGTSTLTPSYTPPARISTQGQYPSPRGCTGSILSVGTAEATTIDADFSGIDCTTSAQSTFRGRVSLTKSSPRSQVSGVVALAKSDAVKRVCERQRDRRGQPLQNT
jgi:hypothetical protein